MTRSLLHALIPHLQAFLDPLQNGLFQLVIPSIRTDRNPVGLEEGWLDHFILPLHRRVAAEGRRARRGPDRPRQVLQFLEHDHANKVAAVLGRLDEYFATMANRLQRRLQTLVSIGAARLPELFISWRDAR